MLQTSMPSTSSSTSQQSVASSALLSYPVLVHTTTNKPFSSCSPPLPLILSCTSTRPPRERSSTALQSPTQRPSKRQTASSLWLLHILLLLSTCSRLHLSNSPSSMFYPFHTLPTPPSHYQDVCSHTRRPLHRLRQSMHTSIPMQPRVLAQPPPPWPLWTRR